MKIDLFIEATHFVGTKQYFTFRMVAKMRNRTSKIRDQRHFRIRVEYEAQRNATWMYKAARNSKSTFRSYQSNQMTIKYRRLGVQCTPKDGKTSSDDREWKAQSRRVKSMQWCMNRCVARGLRDDC